MPHVPPRYDYRSCLVQHMLTNIPAFARAYNLKTHIQTHDPNRLKPYACHHKSCGRSFSRKHDLTRHIQSKHTDLGSPRRKCKVEEAKEEY